MRSSYGQAEPRRKPVAIWVLLGVAAVACVLFPAVRFHRYRTGQPAAAGGGTNAQPEAAAQQFWSARLLPAAQTASDARTVVAAVRIDPVSARRQYAKTPAIGGPSYFFVAGAGWIVSKDKDRVGLSLDEAVHIATPDSKADFVIEIGPLFGNAVRDGTGLLNQSDYPNSTNYNALSAELNKLVKSRVLPTLRERTALGSRVRFAGVAEMAQDEAIPLPLRLVPVLMEVQ